MPRSALLISAVLYTIALTVASFINLNRMPGLGTEWDDKFYHILAYAGLMLIWYFALGRPSSQKELLWLAVFCVVFGIIIEAIQGMVNVSRIGDIMDVAANIVGVIVGYFFAYRRDLGLR